MPFQSLPNWVQFAAFLLAMNAGMINVLSLITVLHQSISHMTGNVSMLAMDLIDWKVHNIIYLVFIIVCFVLGSFYSGFILGNSQFQLGRRYGIPLSLVALFIFISWLLLPYFPRYGLLWACAAMGIQNAMVSHYKGTIIRTTHLSGVLTDIGLALGYKARGLPLDKRRITLLLLILIGFFLGGVAAALIHPLLSIQAFLVPATLSLILSIAYWFIYLRHSSLHQ